MAEFTDHPRRSTSERQVNQAFQDFHLAVEGIRRQIKHFRNIISNKCFSDIAEKDLSIAISVPRLGEFIIGQKGNKLLWKAADAFLVVNGEMLGQIDEEELYSILRKTVYRITILEEACSDESATRKFLLLIGRYIHRKFILARTHILPCVLTPAKSCNSFHIGPVKFFSTAHFFEVYEPEIRSSLSETEATWLLSERQRLLARKPHCGLRAESKWPRLEIKRSVSEWNVNFRRDLESYPWVAVVAIEPSSPKASRSLAEQTIELAMSALQLIFGLDWGSKIRLGNRYRLQQNQAWATIDSNKQMHFSFGRTWEANALTEDWPNLLSSYDKSSVLLIGSLADSVTSTIILPDLYQRVVDALLWYGEGIAEPQPHTGILRFMSALERILVTPGRGRTRCKVIRRGSLLCSLGESHRKQYWREQYSSLYDLRDGIVHGNLSPRDRQIRDGQRTAARLTAIMIRSTLI